MQPDEQQFDDCGEDLSGLGKDTCESHLADIHSSGEEGDWLPAPELAAPISDAGEDSAREAVPLLDSFLGRRTG